MYKVVGRAYESELRISGTRPNDTFEAKLLERSACERVSRSI